VSRQNAALIVGCVAVCAALIASALGWLGGVVVCGADRSPGCVAWPMPVEVLVWGGFMLGVGALVVWQLRYLDR
jgi:hypothetical protein